MNDCLPRAAPTPAADSPKWYDWRGTGTILVVDDDSAIRSVVFRTVGRLGVTADQAGDGETAIALFQADPGRYSLILLDFMMPGMEGPEILARLHAIKPDVHVILMSGLGRQEAVSQFAGLGVAGFLQKPFALENLVAEVRAVVDPR
jgi:DNA-binding response OmpR family regulator